MSDKIIIKGASEHNLKCIDVEIPHNAITVVTGVSGSGKSSLVYDIIFREGQRRYLESFSGYARQHLSKLKRPDVEFISGLKPAISVDQKSVVRNARSTVGTMSGLYDYLRLLFARLGKTNDSTIQIKSERRLFSFNSGYGACPVCKGLGVEDKIDIHKLIEDDTKSLSQGALVITAPNGYIIYSQVTMDVLNQVCNAHGFDVYIPWKDLTDEQKQIVLYGSEIIKIPFGKHTLESRMKWSGITAKPRDEGYYRGIIPIMEEILKRDRNENILRFVSSVKCTSCNGCRLKKEALSFYINDKNIADLSNHSIENLIDFFNKISFSSMDANVGEPIKEAILKRAVLLQKLGLDYLTIHRESTSLSGGEAQRIRLATQVGSGLRNVLYILDEPSIGLHPRDNKRLLEILKELRDNGNTVIVVEHDEETIRNADYLIDIGPDAGIHGGEVLFSGSFQDISSASEKLKSKTINFLNGNESIEIPKFRRSGESDLIIHNAEKNNLKNFDATFKTAAFNVITGVSGSGKSSLIEEFLEQFKNKKLSGYQNIDKIIEVDQSPIGRTPKSNPATYTKLFDHIRDLYASLPESKANKWDKGRFSFNVKGGRCESCQGAGVQQIGMHFLGDVDVLCEECNGKRFHEDTLSVYYKGKNIWDILEMTIDEAVSFFCDKPKIMSFLNALENIGLGYLTLGQSSTTISGGEAQRVKLATELAKSSTKNTVYIFDEPTTGLHNSDIKILLQAFNSLVEKGNTIIAIEHNTDFIKTADWIIDLGPESGEKGGQLLFEGTPENLSNCEKSYSGQEIKKKLNQISSSFSDMSVSMGHPEQSLPGWQTGRRESTQIKRNNNNDLASQSPIEFKGITTNNLKNIDVKIPLNKITIITGVSGSGKSSLAFDTIFSEGQNRFAESFPSYIRAFLSKADKSDFEECKGIIPAISVNQKAFPRNPRSTVGTATEIYDYYRLLYSRAGLEKTKTEFDHSHRPTANMFSFNSEQGACEECRGLGHITVCGPEKLVSHPELPILNGAMKGSKTGAFYGDIYGQYIHTLMAAGTELNIDFSVPFSALNNNAKQIAMYGTGDKTYDVAWNYKRKSREGEYHFQTNWPGFVHYVNEEYHRKHADDRGVSMQNIMTEINCTKCHGTRLKQSALNFYFAGFTIDGLSNKSVSETIVFFRNIENNPTEFSVNSTQLKISSDIRKEILKRLDFLEMLGLGYLSMHRETNTLSGGEQQRVRLASQLGSGLTGVLYVLDEPTIGLHPADTEKLIQIIHKLKALDNTIIIVEHDEDMIRCADQIIDIGPDAGENGGYIIAEGKIEDIITAKNSKTGKYLSLSGKTNFITLADTEPTVFIQIKNAYANNLKNLDVTIPTNRVTVITGVSGSGKSSLLFDVIAESAEAKKARNCTEIAGLEKFNSVILVDQKSIGSSSASNVATYCGFFDEIRNLFASTKQAKEKKINKNKFSFNTAGGRCESCQGNGKIRVSMDFLSDVWTVCEECIGTRYNNETLLYKYEEKNIAEILDMTVNEALHFFRNNKKISHALQILSETGLSYIKLGQSTNTYSGGELQRLKLAKELTDFCHTEPALSADRPDEVKRNLYLFDEPTTGLHFEDTEKLIFLFRKLIHQGHSVIVIEHNMQIIRNADWIIDLGSEGGDKGGEIIATGTPVHIAKSELSLTGKLLKNKIKLS